MLKLKYEVEKKKFSEIANSVKIPKFQRGLVWDKNRKLEFISALKAGLPIGVLLFSKLADDQYLVIDGLQRFSTMCDYAENPFHYIKEDEISSSDAMDVVLSCDNARSIYDNATQLAKEQYLSEIRNAIISNIKNADNIDPYDIAEKARDQICKESALFQKDDRERIQKVVYKIVKRFSENASIDDIQIPIIIFLGSQNELSNIYQSLNQQGVKLSKYDVYAATWVNHTVVVKNDPDFIKRVINKYEDSIKKSGLEVSNFNPAEMQKNGELSVFEYAFGLGKEMAAEAKDLFTSKKDDSKIEGISFLILAELFGLSFFEMGQLAEEMIKYRNVLDFKELKDAIVNICLEVQNTLSPYIKAPTKAKPSLACHADLQLASYIIVMFKLRYTLSAKEGLKQLQGTGKIIKDMKRFLPKHYLFDILRDNWSGAGNVKLEDLLRDPQTCRYVGDIPKPNFEQTIREWLTQGNERHTSSVSTECRLFWNYYLKHKLTQAEIANNNFDIEHCVPKDVLKKYFTNKKISVAVSSPCNLVYIPVGDNRSKEALTYYQKQSENPTAFKLSDSELDRYLYPTRSELRFVEFPEKITPENYSFFLKNRVNTVADKMIALLYP